jgi:glycosyltransferase involved in cell wall biosynthesis
MSSLVSVIIATYNSTPFIIETLESVSKQTWIELELIITDDCSRDNTVEICQAWLNENAGRFMGTKMLTAEKNNGIPGNVNRGLKIAKGDWIKFLGGDDTLKPGCIEDNMTWINTNPQIEILFSGIDVYKDSFAPQNLLETIPEVPENDDWILAKGRSAESQYKLLLTCDRIHFTPSVFLRRETLIRLGGYDERYKLLDDYPLWLKLTRNGLRLYFMPKITVNYRRHSKAVNYHSNCLVNPNYFRQEDFRKEYIYPNLPWDIKLNAYFIWYSSQLFRFEVLNKNRKFNKFLLSLLTVYLNPFKYCIYLRKILVRNLKRNEFYQ